MVVTIDEAEECPHVPMLELFLPPIISWELQERKQERNQISLWIEKKKIISVAMLHGNCIFFSGLLSFVAFQTKKKKNKKIKIENTLKV